MTSVDSGCAMCSGCEIDDVVISDEVCVGDCDVMLFLCNSDVVSDGIGFNNFDMSSKNLSGSVR